MLFFIGLETIPSFGKYSYSDIAADYVLYAISFIAIFYLFYFFIKKEHLTKKGIRALIIFGLLFVFVISAPIACVYIYCLAKEVFELKGNAFLIEFAKYCLSFLETNFLFAMSGALLKVALLRYENIMKQKEIEKQFVKGELALLRSQINPQFLLNTLTNIKSLIETAPPKAIYSIENLSDIMSYMLYDSSAEKVLLEDEISYLENYLDLQKFRFKNPDFYELNVAGNVSGNITADISGVKVPPMIFMPFIEIALKNTDVFSDTPAIVINLNVSDNHLSFEIINHMIGNISGLLNENEKDVSIIKRRLNLLFENNYKLEMKEEDKMYIIRLDIILRGENPQ
jgi:two-component system, LytTR family, sensor kinase